MKLIVTKAKHYKSGKSLWKGDIVEYLGESLPISGIINVTKKCPERLESYSISVSNVKICPDIETDHTEDGDKKL